MLVLRKLPFSRSCRLWWLASLVVGGCASSSGWGQEPRSTPVLLDNFAGPQVAWRLLDGQAGCRVTYHAMDTRLGQFGGGTERLGLVCPAGRSARLAYRIPPAPVIDELQFAAWVWSNRPGLRLAATVVLPRSLDPSTGRPRELLVRGQVADRQGQQLQLSQLPTAVARQTRVARVEHGSQLDERGAYVSQIILLAPGGPGVTELAIDRVEVFGVVNGPVRATPAASLADPTTAGASAAPVPARQHRALEDLLRVIQWQDEPFSLLAKLGFDGVGLQRLPTPAEIEQAEQLGLALISPPPTPQQLTSPTADRSWTAVAMWDLGEPRTEEALEATHRWQKLLKRHDPDPQRPAMVTARLFPREASRIGDIVLFQRPLSTAEGTPREYSTWLTGQQRLTRPGTPVWTAIETQPSPAAAAQTLGPGNPTYAELLASISAAMSAQCRGFYFQSRTSLAGTDPASRLRAMTLELLNLRLGLAQPWIAHGKLKAAARSTVPALTALVLQAEQSHLLMPVAWDDPLGERARVTGPISFVVPGVAESSAAYLLSLAGTQHLRHERVTGGIRVTVEELPHDAYLLLTGDQRAFTQISRYLDQHGPRATRLTRELAAMRYEEAVRRAQQVGSGVPAAHAIQQRLGQARRELQQCDKSLSMRSYELAGRQARTAAETLDSCLSLLPATSPAEDSPAQLSELSTPAGPEQMSASPATEDHCLAGGGFEDLDALREAGWRHQQASLPGITSAVRLSPTAPHRGSYCLELEARPLDETRPPVVVPAPPVWITSAPITAAAGDLVEITGVVRVPSPILGSVDGLQLIDSLGGPSLAQRLPASPTWQPFRIVRVASKEAQVTVTVALTGLGTAHVDELAVRVVKRR